MGGLSSHTAPPSTASLTQVLRVNLRQFLVPPMPHATGLYIQPIDLNTQCNFPMIMGLKKKRGFQALRTTVCQKKGEKIERHICSVGSLICHSPSNQSIPCFASGAKSKESITRKTLQLGGVFPLLSACDSSAPCHNNSTRVTIAPLALRACHTKLSPTPQITLGL